MIFQTRIAGIPCRIEVTHYSEGRCNNWGHPDHRLPDDPGELEFNVLDRCGYRADWLAAKMDWTDEVRIEEEYKAICAMEAA